MSPDRPGARPSRADSFRAVLLVAAVYVVFLLFAQFAFLAGIRSSGHDTAAIHGVLGAMTLCGISCSLAGPFLMARIGPARVVAAGLGASGAACLLAALAFSGRPVSSILLAGIASLTGAGLGLSTVGLASDLRRLARGRAVGLHAGAGTGLAYLFCNIPAIFAAPPRAQSALAAGVGLLGAVVAAAAPGRQGEGGGEREARHDLDETHFTARGIALVTAAFLALVWFDSAVFAAVQADPGQHGRFWAGARTLWTNGAVHAAAALAAGVAIDRGRFVGVLLAAAAALIAGARLFGAAAGAWLPAAPVYVAGVSLYSTALVAYAALHRPDPRLPPPTWRAAWVYAVAGWFGSAAGVGLAEQRGGAPDWTPLACALLIGAATTALVAGRRRPEGATP